MTNENFRISSGLKSIIGRELITDDFIAVFELVKNSFDAHATRVDITFAESENEGPSIVIRDNGKGMGRKDLLDKWLFVAYSAKKEGVEDYRQKINSHRLYAGAKGIGRFSCDKLGSHLELITRKNSDTTAYSLNVNWDLFEQDSKEEFIDIPVTLKPKNNVPDGFNIGTILKITNLRETWDREKLLRLKRSLEKLINPNQENTKKAFSVFLHAPSENETDKEVSKEEPWNKVNGKIENFLFDKLKIKSTHIHVSIDSEGKFITTQLDDRGKFIYMITEENEYDLHDIKIDLFALNTSAKNTFTRQMGVQPVKFGSVFLFKNGFRIYPFGEEGEDSWGIDRRKQQGVSRFLGTRDLIGRVEINGENEDFQEASSRDGGLIQTGQVKQLREFFINHVLKRLERFAVDVIKYGNKELPDGEFESKVMELILQLTKSKSILSVQYNPRILDILKEASEKSLNSLVSQFGQIVERSDNPQLERDIKKAEKRIHQLESAREEAEEEAAKAEEERRKAEQDAEEQREKAKKAESVAQKAKKNVSEFQTQNLFLQSLVSADVENLVGLHHHIGIAASAIKNHVNFMTRLIRSNKPVSTDMFLDTLEKISLQASHIASSAGFGTKANFVMEVSSIKGDLVEFLREYVMNVCEGSVCTKNNNDRMIKFSWKSKPNIKLVRQFNPIEIVVLLDNLISNSKKADAKKISFNAEMSDDLLRVTIQDDGKGVAEDRRDRVFDIGYTTTNGSGFGLYHASKIAENFGGTLELCKSTDKGAKFLWEIPK